MGGLWGSVMDREVWCAAIHGATKSRALLSNWTELNLDVPTIWFLLQNSYASGSSLTCLDQSLRAVKEVVFGAHICSFVHQVKQNSQLLSCEYFSVDITYVKITPHSCLAETHFRWANWDYVKVKVTQSCLTLWDPMDYKAHGIL